MLSPQSERNQNIDGSRRRWRLLLVETVFAGLLFLLAVFMAKPVFLTPLQDEPEAPLTSDDILSKVRFRTILGYAPNTKPYETIMKKAASLLNMTVINARTEDDLNNIIYNISKGALLKTRVCWVLWKPKEDNMWKFTIRSTDRARFKSRLEDMTYAPINHLRSGFLGIQLAVSRAILEYSSSFPVNYEVILFMISVHCVGALPLLLFPSGVANQYKLLQIVTLPAGYVTEKHEQSLDVHSGEAIYINFKLVAMPVSPLMQQYRVQRAISSILLCFIIALVPPVMETEVLVVTETVNRFKRALRMRNVDYSSMYIGWLVYAYLTALPICLLGGITLIFIFRWIHLMYALIYIFTYVSIMNLIALIMAMFHSKAWNACVWTTLFALLQTFLAELLVHHQYDTKHEALTLILHIILPPLGLVHGFNQFALLQTGQGWLSRSEQNPLSYTLIPWVITTLWYFGILMLLQRTIGHERAIGGQVHWKSIIFKKKESVSKLHEVESPTGRERDKLQEVDEFVAKAFSFKNVSKSIMGVPVLNNITFDVYRGEYTMLLTERIQEKLLVTLEDLLTGLTYPDKGTVNVLGHDLKPGLNFMTEPYMTGYCHSSKVLIGDLTVREHLILFTKICLWQESSQYIQEFGQLRSKRLQIECDLDEVKHEYVRNLSSYYRAQLCWAIALIMEPRIIIISNYIDTPAFKAVIKDKIMTYRSHITIIKMCFVSILLEYVNRVFVFDNKVLVFGGTPAYMFFKYGREYRVRMTFRSSGQDDESLNELLERATSAGATVRAHLGSLLILRLPANPTAAVASLVKELNENANKYGITSLNISLPDSEEVCRRAINESRAATSQPSASHQTVKLALKKIGEPPQWKRKKTRCINIMQLRNIGWKYFSFYIHYRFFMIITVISAILASVYIGMSFANMLTELESRKHKIDLLEWSKLTVEEMKQNINLVLRADNSSEAISVANAYVLSETDAAASDDDDLTYTALKRSESLTEYLVIRAIDSPQHYVYMYAYGMDVFEHNGKLHVYALYSPLHRDQAAAARSVARVHMALLRHYTRKMNATIQITDNPLTLDMTPWLTFMMPSLIVQFLLILTISHITLLPSKEYGLIRHMQMHAMDYSPTRYWLSLYFCDIILYWFLVVLMSVVIVITVYIIVPAGRLQFGELIVIPFILIIYGIGSVPQAYLFSLGRGTALNSVTFVIVNIVFGETTIVAKIFYGYALQYILSFMNLSPQYNMAYAYVKIKKIFLYNSECSIYKITNFCSTKVLHKCCKKCGVMQKCFSRKSYFWGTNGVWMEVAATLFTAVLFLSLLLLWEYKLIQRGYIYVMTHWVYPSKLKHEPTQPGAIREKRDVLDKKKQIRNQKCCQKVDTFGEYLLADNISKRKMDVYLIRGISFGLGKGEALALSGLKRHGRLHLCEVLSGFKLPNNGQLWCMSKWKLKSHPHLYARHVSLSCEQTPLPQWMTVYDALELIALLRGIPKKYVAEELTNYIEALELHDQADTLICRLLPIDRYRVHFAAAVVGAPPILILDECTAYQKYSVRRAIYTIIYHLRKRGHAIFISSSSVESHMPVTNRLAILVDGQIFDIDQVDNMVERYSKSGFTVVVHLKDEVDINDMFGKYFNTFTINDISEVLVNVQVLDRDLNWATIFEKMERLKAENQQVYSYIVTAIPIDYIYNSIIANESGQKTTDERLPCHWLRFLAKKRGLKTPTRETVEGLKKLEQRYDITTLKELPWSVIFNR